LIDHETHRAVFTWALQTIISCLALLQASAADEPLIPAPLNDVLPRIQPGMSTETTNDEIRMTESERSSND